MSVDKLYTQNTQLQTISGLLGSAELGDQFIDPKIIILCPEATSQPKLIIYMAPNRGQRSAL
jgi:hypothetical protein